MIRAQNVLQQELARVPTEREIAESLGLSESAVREVYQTQEMIKVASLDSAGQNEDDGDTEVEKLDAAAFCPEQVSMEDRLVLEHAMRQLRDLEREVLVLFHFESMNQTEIAGKLNISCNYVSHILRQSLAKLRKILVSEGEKDRVLRRQAAEIDYDVIEPITGAYTEAFFKTRLEEEVHRASSQDGELGVVLINFQGLDTLQTFYGARSVSDFMSDAAEFCRKNLRRLDLVCKIGDNGFGIILPSTGQTVVPGRERLIEKVQGWMSARQSANSPVRVEIGFADFPVNGKTTKKLIENAKPMPLESKAKAA